VSLTEYKRKRDFSKTPEPAPKPAASKKSTAPSRFFVQRHDATRLHYDLRLEIDGTLKSWAVPKGPSLDPAKKNLAMHVEDHPLDYGPFEGNIPAGNYGAGSVMLWDYGTVDYLYDMSGHDQYQRGEIKFRLHGQKVNGEYVIVQMKGRGKGNEWLLIKKKDEHAVPGWDTEDHAYSAKTGRTQQEIAADLPPRKPQKKKRASQSAAAPSGLPGARKAPMPGFFPPMLASLATRLPAPDKWVYEIKWDGVRALCFLEKDRIRLYSRNGNSFDRQYPELGVVPRSVRAETAILDGEIAVLDEQGRSRFELIQPRIHQTDPNSASHLARRNPAKLFVFDLLYCDGYDLREVPLLERKKLLAEIVEPSDGIQVSGHFTAEPQQMLDAAREAGLEGVIAKCSDSKYESRRSKNWLKVKVVGQQEFIICGFTHGDRLYFSSLVLGVREGDDLVYAGNAGTGFNDRNLPLLWKELEPRITPKCPFKKIPAMLRSATWVKPELVCECKFAEWTRDGKLRAPVFLGLRKDKAPEEVVRETPEATPAEERPAPAELIPKGAKELTVTIDGHSLKFSNLQKVMFPKDKVTKADILNYYNAVAELIIPHLKDRPLSLKRYPNGIHEEYFFQKNVEYADWLRTEAIPSEHRGAPINYVICNDRATLLYLTNLGCIDQNPWMSRIGSLECPDFVLIDLDPQETSFDKIVEAALLVKEKLDLVGLEGYPKTTGGDGLHVYIPIEPRYTYEQARSFAEIISGLCVQDNPNLFTTPRSVQKRRKNRVYFDWMQLSYSKTIAAPYVLRARDGAPVATPLKWSEVKPGLTPEQFHIRNAIDRFRKCGDLFAPVLTNRQRLEPALKKLSKLVSSQ
jgi:bifunctional non-homologous end joining protein LigD